MTNRHELTSGQKLIKYAAITLAVLVIAGIASGIAELIEAVFGGGRIGEMRRYEISEDVSGLDMEIGGAAFSVVHADGFAVESNIEDLTVNANRGELRIKEKAAINKDSRSAKITLYIPENFVFDIAEIETGAGDFNLTHFSAERLTLTLGAGNVEIGELNITEKAEIEGGAGAFTIKGGSIRNLDLEMGVGNMEIRAEVLGKSELNLGIGKTAITLLGKSEDYRLDIEKALGKLTVDGTKYNGSTVLGGGDSLIEIECAIGDVNVSFEALPQS